MSPTTYGASGAAVHDHQHLPLPVTQGPGVQVDPWESIERARAGRAIQSPI